METQATILTSIRERLDEASAHAWTDIALRRWINEGARDIARRTECLQAVATISAVAGTQQYTGPTDTVRIYRVEYKATGDSNLYPLEYRDFHNMDEVWWSSQTITQSTPSMYTMWGFPPQLKLVIYPTPAIAGTFNVYYYRLPADLAVDGSAAASTVETPQGWQDVIVDYAFYTALLRDGDPRYQEAKASYDARLMDLYATATRWTDEAGMVSAAGSMVPRFIWDEGY